MAGDSAGPTQPGKIAQSGSIFDGQNPIRSSNHLTLFLVQMIIIISLARLLGVFLRKIHQPRVIAEVIGGILLGPSVFGRIPGFTDVIFPPESIGYLKLVAEIGLILFLFLVGLELDPSMLVANAKQSAFISIAGMTVPFGLGVAASSALYNYLMPQPSTVPFSSFFLFLGVAMSITAFPVLARILTEKKILKSRVGMTTISAAAVDDFASWCFLGLVISIINATNGINALYTFLLVIAYAAILILGVRKILLFLIRWSSSSESLSEVMVFVTFALIFVSAFVTEVIGVHAIFGAFLVGVIIPHGDGFALKLTEKIEDIVTIVFLPLYFASSGLKTNVGLIDSPLMAGMVFLVIFVACAGKILGCLTASKLSGLNWRESLAVGILMNTKGLVELIVLNLGLDAGVINDKVFVIMVLMALVTTFMTSPLISWIYPIHLINKDRERFSSSFELSKISSIGEGADPTSPETEPCLAEDLRALVCLETMDSVPTLMHLVQIFQYYRHFYPDRPLTVHALRLMELSERTSAVMKAAESSATLKFDPIINVFKTFGGLNSIDVNPILSVSTVQDFGENIVSYAELYNVNFILLPWLFSDSLGLDQFFDTASGRRKQHRDMVSYVLKNSNVSVGVLVDRGF
ncbi:Sodium/hydrogen exchanger family-domain-containing protein, partial [Paraphysoderma sedebokerense]